MLKRRRGYATKERMLTDIFRLPRWRDPGPRRVHGRHHPLHHPQRQGPRYDQRIRHRKPQPEILDANMRKLQSVRMTFSASSSPSVRPGGSDKRAPKACVCDFWDCSRARKDAGGDSLRCSSSGTAAACITTCGCCLALTETSMPTLRFGRTIK